MKLSKETQFFVISFGIGIGAGVLRGYWGLVGIGGLGLVFWISAWVISLASPPLLKGEVELSISIRELEILAGLDREVSELHEKNTFLKNVQKVLCGTLISLALIMALISLIVGFLALLGAL